MHRLKVTLRNRLIVVVVDRSNVLCRLVKDDDEFERGTDHRGLKIVPHLVLQDKAVLIRWRFVWHLDSDSDFSAALRRNRAQVYLFYEIELILAS